MIATGDSHVIYRPEPALEATLHLCLRCEGAIRSETVKWEDVLEYAGSHQAE